MTTQEEKSISNQLKDVLEFVAQVFESKRRSELEKLVGESAVPPEKGPGIFTVLGEEGEQLLPSLSQTTLAVQDTADMLMDQLWKQHNSAVNTDKSRCREKSEFYLQQPFKVML